MVYDYKITIEQYTNDRTGKQNKEQDMNMSVNSTGYI